MSDGARTLAVMFGIVLGVIVFMLMVATIPLAGQDLSKCSTYGESTVCWPWEDWNG